MQDNEQKQGTSGARKGYKVFSINTTIRNPKRNTEFLEVFKRFDGCVMDDLNLYNYLFALVQKGIYKFSKIPTSVKEKLEANVPLDIQEVKEAIKENPQATGLSGRVMTQLRALKDQGFLIFEESDISKKHKISITKLGNDLIENKVEASIVYTKAMIGMHANSPVRKSLHNESVPFLNTLFVVDEVNRRWKELGNEAKGILMHEFSAFVLSMKDCNYHVIADEIIAYRKKFKTNYNYPYLRQYLTNNGILPLAEDSLLTYGDEVFRKFEMTGLLVKHGKFSHIYITFSNYNVEKVNSILFAYKDYHFIKFENQKSYYDYLDGIILPWESNEHIRRQIVNTKADVLGIKLEETMSLEQQEEMLDRIFYSQALAKAVDNTELKFINKELLILGNRCNEKSKLEDISESLRLEYLLALLLGKIYGVSGLVSNIIYDENGTPLHHAPSNKADIIYHSVDGSYILEPTMQCGRDQQLNSETTNIVRHMLNEKTKNGIEYRVAMVAPKVHEDVVDYFGYSASRNEVKITALTIACITDLINKSSTILSLNSNFDLIVDELKVITFKQFADNMNAYILSDSLKELSTGGR